MLNRLLLISVVIILALTAWYFVNERNNVISSQDFIIADTSAIDKIIIEKDNISLTLLKKDRTWLLNDTFQVNYGLLKRFLRVFHNLNLVAPISSSSRDTVIRNLRTKSTKISIYIGDNLSKEYLIGDLNSSGSGNIVLLNEKKLAVVNSMLLVQNLHDIVSVNSLFWRNRMIFNKNTNQITYISYKNIRDTKKSFSISLKNDVLTLYDRNNTEIEHFNETAVLRYLSYFQNIGFVQIENSLSLEQTNFILKNNHANTITLLDDSNIGYELNLYLKPENISQKVISKEFDLNQIYGKMNDEGNLLVFEYYIIDPILKDIEYFFK